MKVLGIGIDIVEVSRLKQAVRNGGSRFMNRVFSKRELVQLKGRRDPYEGLAARFAVKEAVVKAFGARRDAPKSLPQIEILKTRSGVPVVTLPTKNLEVLISMSHSKEYAVASALLLQRVR